MAVINACTIRIEPELADRVARYGWQHGMNFQRSRAGENLVSGVSSAPADTFTTFTGSKSVVDKLSAYRDGLKDAPRLAVVGTVQGDLNMG